MQPDVVTAVLFAVNQGMDWKERPNFLPNRIHIWTTKYIMRCSTTVPIIGIQSCKDYVLSHVLVQLATEELVHPICRTRVCAHPHQQAFASAPSSSYDLSYFFYDDHAH